MSNGEEQEGDKSLQCVTAGSLWSGSRVFEPTLLRVYNVNVEMQVKQAYKDRPKDIV